MLKYQLGSSVTNYLHGDVNTTQSHCTTKCDDVCDMKWKCRATLFSIEITSMLLNNEAQVGFKRALSPWQQSVRTPWRHKETLFSMANVWMLERALRRERVFRGGDSPTEVQQSRASSEISVSSRNYRSASWATWGSSLKQLNNSVTLYPHYIPPIFKGFLLR